MNPQIVQELKRQIDLLRREYGDELAGDDALMLDTLEGETDFNRIIGRLVQAVNEIEAWQSANNQLSAHYRGRAERFAKRKEATRGVILDLLQCAGLPGLKLPEATISVLAGRNTVSIEDVNELPQGYFETVTSRLPVKDAITAALGRGEIIPGAIMQTGKPSISIRSK